MKYILASPQERKKKCEKTLNKLKIEETKAFSLRPCLGYNTVKCSVSKVFSFAVIFLNCISSNM